MSLIYNLFFQRLSKEKSVTRSDSSSDISVLSNPSEASIEVIRPEVTLQPPSADVVTSAVSPIHHELQVEAVNIHAYPNNPDCLLGLFNLRHIIPSFLIGPQQLGEYAERKICKSKKKCMF